MQYHTRKKVGERLREAKLRLEVFWQEEDKSTDDRDLAAYAETSDEIDRVAKQPPQRPR